ncbi:fluoride efflux transporter FluC [Ornithinimicrobium sp. Y1847]|uniref:fluoride efflux transporter FluC n=1 Tax=unclassified Ornithinimicrobium TaxID=2615080 RepID=UPI003B681828
MTGMPWGWALLLVALGGAAGAVLRYVVTLPPAGPFRGVFAANVVGAWALGLLVGLADRLPEGVSLLLGTGICGALTTWSTLAVQTWELGRVGLGRAAAYLGGTVVLGVATGLLGWWLGSAV